MSKKTSKPKLKAGKKLHNKKLKKLTRQIRIIMERSKTDIYLMGESLYRAKRILDHGEFQEWIDDNFEFSYQTANNYINVYKYCLGHRDIVKTMRMSILYQIASPKFPDDLRQHIFKSGKKLKLIKNKDMRDLYHSFKKSEIGLDSPEIEKLFQENRSLVFKKGYNKKIATCIKQLKNLKKSILPITKSFQWPVSRKTDKIEMSEQQEQHVTKILNDISDAISRLKPGANKQDIDSSLSEAA